MVHTMHRCIHTAKNIIFNNIYRTLKEVTNNDPYFHGHTSIFFFFLGWGDKPKNAPHPIKKRNPPHGEKGPHKKEKNPLHREKACYEEKWHPT